MFDDQRVQQLLEEILDSQSTPEEACRTCPELLPQVRAGWQRVRAVQAQIGFIFPQSPVADEAATHQPSVEGASIPGYEVLDVLGRGGMSVVYKATHLALKRTVALKMLAAGYPHATERARFRAEAEAVAKLQHPNIVQIHEIGEVEGRPFIALEYVAGGSLAARLKGQVLDPRDAARLVATLGEAMHLAHSRNLIHRDLKPANVLLAGEINVPIAQCQPKVTDFGLVRQLDADSGCTFDGMVMGTPSYMAPEQAEGRAHSAGPAADVYALGAILYECLTGRRPFNGATAGETLDHVRHREPSPPASLNPRVPRDLETICLKCLRKEPERRYSSARELADDLERFLATKPIVARPVGLWERATKWARRRPAEAALMVAAVLLLVGGSAGALWYIADRNQRHLDQVLRDTEMQNRRQQVNRQVNLALDDAERHLREIRSQLQDPVKTAVWLSEPDLWRGTLEKGQQAFQRTAQSAVLGTEAILEPSTDARLGFVSTGLKTEANNFAMVKELDDIELLATGPVKGKLQPGIVIPKYAKFFADHGMDIVREDKARITAAIMKSPIRFVLVAALDHWAESTTRPNAESRELLPKLLELARAADPDPWRDRFRDSEAWSDPAVLMRMANEVDAAIQPSAVLAALGTLLHQADANPTAFYKRALLAHPRDFWLHQKAALREPNGDESAGMYLAALAVRPKSSWAYTNLAFALSDQHDSEGAIVACRKAIELDPNYADAHNVLGLALRELKDFPGAIAAHKKAIDLDPHDADFHYNLGFAFTQQTNLPEAIAAYKRAIELNSKDADFYYELGLALDEQKEVAGAIAAFEKAVELDKKAVELKPKNARAYSRLGRTLRKLHDFPGAVAACRKAIELNPKDAEACYELGFVLHEQKDLPGAIAAYKKAIELDPRNADAYYELGFSLEQQKDYSAALAAYEKAIDLGMKDAAVYNSLGNALRGIKQFDRAIVAHKKAIELDPKYTFAHSGLGSALREKKQLDEAIPFFKKAIELNPKFAYAYNGLGKTLAEKKQWDEAIAACKKAIELDPKYALAHHNLAWILATCPDAKIRDGKRAIEHATKACKLSDWKTGSYVGTLAAAYAEAGDFERAARHQTAALSDRAYEAEFGDSAQKQLDLYKQMKPFHLPP